MYYEAAKHPAVVLAVMWPLLALLARAWQSRTPSRWRWAVIALSAPVLVSFAAIVTWYASRAAYFDPAEPTIGAVAFVFGEGKPLYPALAEPERYAHVYGPVLFFVQRAAFAVAGP